MDDGGLERAVRAILPDIPQVTATACTHQAVRSYVLALRPGQRARLAKAWRCVWKGVGAPHSYEAVIRPVSHHQLDKLLFSLVVAITNLASSSQYELGMA